MGDVATVMKVAPDVHESSHLTRIQFLKNEKTEFVGGKKGSVCVGRRGFV